MDLKFSFGKFIFGNKRRRYGRIEEANFDFRSPQRPMSGDEESKDVGGNLDVILLLLLSSSKSRSKSRSSQG